MSWLVLTGYMGAGKSTGGRMIADAAGAEFADSDALIEQQAGLPIPRIFATKGELWFRRMEERVIRDLVAREPQGVLSIGGGAVESEKTRNLLGRVADVVYLEADPAVLWARVSGSGRPLATDEARFNRRFARRAALYEGLADLTVDATAPDQEAVARDVAAWWRGRG
ncbi:MAG: shikimate kinase [Thermoleophilia bacterium]|nr:shikimate kinase [Thermoleophilia bacterium]